MRGCGRAQFACESKLAVVIEVVLVAEKITLCSRSAALIAATVSAPSSLASRTPSMRAPMWAPSFTTSKSSVTAPFRHAMAVP
jgi:hypothetical protein